MDDFLRRASLCLGTHENDLKLCRACPQMYSTHHCPREKGHQSLRSSVGTGEIQAVQSHSKDLQRARSAAPRTSSDINVFSSLNLGKARK